jgi:hypothetical protein
MLLRCYCETVPSCGGSWSAQLTWKAGTVAVTLATTQLSLRDVALGTRVLAEAARGNLQAEGGLVDRARPSRQGLHA